MSKLRPPLPPPLSHEGILFVPGAVRSGEISQETLSLIASALGNALPAGDFTIDASGTLHFSTTESPSLWRSVGRLEAVERSPR
jgi:hypothetical protein